MISPANPNTSPEGWTDAPWNLYRDEDGNVISILKHVIGDGGGVTGRQIARMPIPSKTVHKNAETNWPEINANARLMAAAPALYEALKALDDLWSEDFPTGADDPKAAYLMPETKAVWRLARSALLKAKASDNDR
jgi:hypothetical protein